MYKRDVCLALSGSGMLYPGHVGAIKALTELGYTFRSVSGTSGGAMIASLLACGYSCSEIEDIVRFNLPINGNLIDASFFYRFGFGFIKGNRIYELFQKLFKKCGVVKFKDTKIPLTVITTNLNQRRQSLFSTQDTPDFEVATAVRASMSIPGIFKAITIHGDYHIDGFFSNNFPIDVFSKDDSIIGLKIASDSYDLRYTVSSYKDFINGLVALVFDKTTIESIEDAPNAKICTLDIPGNFVNFKLSMTECSSMIDKGYQDLKNHNLGD